MKLVLRLWVLFCIIGLFGCAAKGPVDQNQEASSVIELKCKSANRLGCRHKGNTYPWNAWVEMKGYKSTEYTVQEIKQAGNKAIVMVVKR